MFMNSLALGYLMMLKFYPLLPSKYTFLFFKDFLSLILAFQEVTLKLQI